MVSIKVKFRPSKMAEKEGVIYYQIIRNRVVRQIASTHRVATSEWDERLECIVPYSADLNRVIYLERVGEQIKLDLERLRYVILALNRGADKFSADDVVRAFKREQNGVTFCNFTEEVISRLRELRRERCVETYTTTLRSFMRFRGGEDILLSDISSDIMIGYEAYLKYEGVSMNTVSFYIRVIRAIYNRAVEQDIIEQRSPFKRVYTGVDKTVKRALSLNNIKIIKELDLSSIPQMAFARDMFLFSFYTRGMSFVDMAFLRKKDLQNGVISYRRRKTGQQLHIKWERCMQEIIARYPPNETEFLLPIITNPGVDTRCLYLSMLAKINGQLKKIAENIALQIPLTMYVARHSWASVAKSKNVPLSVISEGMGHDSETTTQIYLTSLDVAVVDRANHMILKLLA